MIAKKTQKKIDRDAKLEEKNKLSNQVHTVHLLTRAKDKEL